MISFLFGILMGFVLSNFINYLIDLADKNDRK